MRARRIGLTLAVFLAIAGLAPALDIRPDPATGQIGPLPIAAAVIAALLALATLVLVIPAWRGRHGPARVIAILQLAGILQAVPVFFLPVRVIPPGAVILAALGALLGIVAFTLILYDSSRVLLGSAAVVVVVVLYACLVAGASAILPVSAERTVQTASAILVALLFTPVLTLMRRIVGRSLYGGRVDPAGTALRINDVRGDSGNAVEAAVAKTRRALRFPRLELTEHDHAIISAGVSPAGAATATLLIDPDAGLAFRVTLRPGQSRLHPDDRSALRLVAAPLALLLRESALTADLRAARADAARVREDERATIHRELHDGLGPLLTGAAFRVDAARKQVPADASRAADNLDLARANLGTAISEVRRVVYGLRPIELEQRSVWSAVARRAGSIGAALTLPEPLPELSTATELAVYRIVNEAIANIERHAPDSGVHLDIATSDDVLRIDIRNDGFLARQATEGVGSRSMRDRTEELGGRYSAGPTPEGWSVRVDLPLS